MNSTALMHGPPSALCALRAGRKDSGVLRRVWIRRDHCFPVPLAPPPRVSVWRRRRHCVLRTADFRELLTGEGSGNRRERRRRKGEEQGRREGQEEENRQERCVRHIWALPTAAGQVIITLNTNATHSWITHTHIHPHTHTHPHSHTY